MKTFPENLKDSVIGPDEIHLPRSNPSREENVRKYIDADHVRNFLDAVKSRQDPIEPVEVGFSTASLCLLGNMAQLLKRKFTWDRLQSAVRTIMTSTKCSLVPCGNRGNSRSLENRPEY